MEFVGFRVLKRVRKIVESDHYLRQVCLSVRLSVCLSVRPAWNKSASIERGFIKFYYNIFQRK